MTSIAALLFLIFSLKALHEGEQKNNKEQKAQVLEQNDEKSAARCRLLNRWPGKPGDEVVLFLAGEQKNKEWNGETTLRLFPSIALRIPTAHNFTHD